MTRKENVVPVVDFQEDPSPFLVMPYLFLGSLEDLNSEKFITVEETVDLLFQTLRALCYLHARGVAHRDLKPQNILVESRLPLRIKLADFGLANDKPDLTTICGTRQYTAPEIYLGSKYTTSVDLWSLGVIVLEYAYELPESIGLRGKHSISLSTMAKSGLVWCQSIVDSASDWESDALVDLLTTGMLRMKPDKRLSADACLTKGHDLGLFNGYPLGSNNVIPRQTAQQYSADDDAGSTTILLNALRDSEENPVHNNNACCTPERTSGVRTSCGLRASTALNHEDGQVPQLQSFRTAVQNRAIQSLIPPSCPLEVRSTDIVGSKRQRSPALDPAAVPSGRKLIKRRPSKTHFTDIAVSHSYNIPSSCYHVAPDHFFSRCDTVLTLLKDLLRHEGNDGPDMDDCTGTLIKELCQHLARLEVTKIRLIRTDCLRQTIIATGSDCQEIVFASPIPFELISSLAGLAAHLLTIMQPQSPRPPSIPTAPLSDPPLKADIAIGCKHFQSLLSANSHTTVSTVVGRGVTFPSGLLDAVNVSGCTIPVEPSI